MIAGPDLRRAFVAACGIVLGVPHVVDAQGWAPRVYILNVPVFSASGQWSSASASHISRVRVMADPSYRSLRLDVAYEHLVQVRLQGSPAAGGVVFGALGGGGDWLPLQGTVLHDGRVTWRHRVDRLAVRWASSAVEVTAGRQTISWASTIMLTPADPFQPFDPADPFRTYRAGVDALRVRVFTGPFASVEAVGRVFESLDGATGTLLARWASDWGRLGAAAWAGMLHDRAAASVGLTVTAGGAVFRGEAAVRETIGDPVLRVAVGVDRSFQIADRTLYALVEFQHDGFGGTGPADYLGVAASDPARRGELQTVGRDLAAGTLSYAIHPLVSLGLLSLVNLRDPSVLAAPSLTWSVGQETTLRVGGYLGAGAVTEALTSTVVIPGSEFGPVPLIGFAAFEMFF
ncbi:MAG TPA: hypothetical protein VGA22_03185 [Gemmatimonadales bacterium]|jgi:hypothetical protein